MTINGYTLYQRTYHTLKNKECYIFENTLNVVKTFTQELHLT